MYLRVAFSLSVSSDAPALSPLLLLPLTLSLAMPMSARYCAASWRFHSSSLSTMVCQSVALIARLCTPSAPMRARYTSMSGFHAA
jgi:hypothetical protein